MTGFIKKLFRAKPKDAEDSAEVAKPEVAKSEVIKPKKMKSEVIKPAQAERGNAYYLSADEAQTFGNLEYMRSSKTVRHTFPKGKVGKDNARIRAISYAEAINSDSSLPPAPLMPNSQAASQAAQGSGSVSSDASRRRPDSSMDAFRNMAREIKKG